MDTELLTIPDAAKRLRVSRSYGYELAKRRVIPTLRFGKAIRVPVVALDEWIKDNTRPATRTAGEMTRPPSGPG